ncbi:MAG: hypothetical protein HZB85_08360 [Deltaproteobacteria bacterium]|nr:hypothetical protein [Deltaproteobacteria bacterium]
MRKIILIALMAIPFFALASCSEQKKADVGVKEQPQSTGEVMKQYTDTLAGAKHSAEAVKKAADANTAEKERQLKEMDKQ